MLVSAFVSGIIFVACTNPFAPSLSDTEGDALLGDQRTVEGLFTNFRYAYIFKDTVVYGNLLAPDFTFSYIENEKGTENTWSREEDMLTTSRLFNAAQSFDLFWNEVITSAGDTSEQSISRGFILTINFSPTDITRIYGRVNLLIIRPNTQSEWKILNWRDESNF